MSLIVVGLSHRTASVPLLERATLSVGEPDPQVTSAVTGAAGIPPAAVAEEAS